MKKPLVIDGFVFADELDVLEIRLAELYDYVDYFILVEANRTQTRLEKPFYYKNNIERYSKWNDKIISIQLDQYIEGGEADWRMENWQRMQILKGLDILHEKGINLVFSDYLMVSDLDEIPKGEILGEKIYDIKEPTSINLYFTTYFANLYCPTRGWYGTVITPLKYVQNNYHPQYLRSIKDNVSHIGIWNKEFCGWHLSAMGGFETVWKKAKNNIEPHNKENFLDDRNKESYRNLFDKHVIEEKYFLFLDRHHDKSLKLEILDNSKLPQYLINNEDKFKSFFYPKTN